MRVVFAGTPEFARPALEALLAHHRVAGVLTQPDRPSGRGRTLSLSAVKAFAQAHHLPVFQPASLRTAAAHAQLTAWQPEVLVVVAYGLVLPPEVLELPRLGCLNIHASLLPRWRGAAPVQRAILAGDTATGITIMRMDEGLDTGPVLLQERLAIAPDDTSGSLHAALARVGAAALLEALAGLAAGTLKPRPQPHDGVTCAAKIDKAEGRIDWSADAQAIERQVRAFNPRPVAETVLAGERLRIYAAQARPDRDTPSDLQRSGDNSIDPGMILAVQDGFMLVRCGHGLLAVGEVQKPGGRVLAVRDFAHNVSLAGRQLG